MRLLLLLPCLAGAFQLSRNPSGGGCRSEWQEERARRRPQSQDDGAPPSDRAGARTSPLFGRQRPTASRSAPASLPFRLFALNKSRESTVLSAAPTASSSSSSSSTAAESPAAVASIQAAVEELKRVIEREYANFFDPMEREWYSPSVTFDDPLFSLSGVDAYQANVDMLASRTLLGKFLFEDAGIVLHSVEGGAVGEGESAGVAIQDVVTRWTLRMTAKVLPWQPTARFSGVSVYRVVPGGPRGVQVVSQADYWDSINLVEGGTTAEGSPSSSYRKVGRGAAVKDFLGQLGPANFAAPAAGPELPYSLLRRGRGYEVRGYPAVVAVEMDYERRDEGFLTLGSVTSGLGPLSPAILTVPEGGAAAKTMAWPLAFAPPGSVEGPDPPPALLRRLGEYGGEVRVARFPPKVVAVGAFTDASVEPVVRRADRDLRASLRRDGLLTPSSSTAAHLRFAQYDAVYTMGKRRGEVWIDLEEGTHPWSLTSK